MFRFLFLTLLLLINCTNRHPGIEGFDEVSWTADPNGCKGVRSGQIAQLMQHKDELLGLDENEVRNLLGPPDRHELYVRGQKFFQYFTSPGPPCSLTEGAQQNSYLSIRFNALGRSSEIIWYK